MGVTYADAIKRARQAISLPDLGIEGVRSRTAATGARLIEVSGSESGAKADQLAKRLELVLSDVATIVRPEKYAEIRVSGLDSSLSTDDVAAELAARAGCSVEDLRVGRIRAGPNQAGSTIVRCPMRVAKALVEAGRFLLGWDFAQVVALEPRPMRCYRCMGVGHTRQRCPSAVDRTGLCFRCGLPGHQARGCSKEPRCAVCAVAKKPHAHIMGGRGCSPPAVRARPVPPEQKGTTAQRMPAEVEPSVELPLDRTEEMETVEEPPPSPKVPTTDHPNVSLERDTGSEGGRVVEVEDPGEGPSGSTTPAWERPRAPDGRFAKAAVKPTPKTGPPTSGGPR